MEVTGKQISLRPTQHGFLFLGILIAMLLGSINYNNNAGFILVFLLGSMAVISLAISYKNLIGLTIIAGHPFPVFAGESGCFPVSVTAPKTRGQALFLFLDSPILDSLFPVSVPPSGSLTTDLPVTARSRGYRIPGHIRLESVFPLGLFRLKVAIPNTTGILVYPTPDAGMAGTGFSGNQPCKDTDKNQADRDPDTSDADQSDDTMGPDDFQGLAAYVPGSPVGHISWKTLSRGKGLFIKNFTEDRDRELLFDLDRTEGEDLEQRLSVLCRAILEAEKNGYRYGLKLGTESLIPPSSGNSHKHNCLKSLALYEKAPQDSR